MTAAFLRHEVVAHPRCEAAVPQGGCPIFMLFCIHIYANVNRFLRPIFQFMAPLPSIYLFMIFLFTFYANDLLILCIISFT
jgi:ABC-type nitrate/sulfonate/bicarbonate transport system permease component